MDPPADVGAVQERRYLPLGEAAGKPGQPVSAPAGGEDRISARPQGIDALEQLGARQVELVAERVSGHEVVGVEEHLQDESVEPLVGEVLALGEVSALGHHACDSTSRLRSTARDECVRAPTET